MNANFNTGRCAVVVLAVLLVSAEAQSQQLFYNWIGPNEGNWNVDANWDGNGLNFVPSSSIAAGESARINNGGTAVVSGSVPRVAGLNVATGTLRVQGNGVVETAADAFGNGALSIGAVGTVNLLDTGRLTIGGPATNAGTLRLTGPGTRVNVAGSFGTSGTVAAGITSSNSHGLIDAAGDATLSGSLRIAVSGFTPAFGQSWNIVEGATLNGGFNNLVVDSSPPLARGLNYQLAHSGTTASVRVGNSLILSVNRQSGATSIANVVGGPIGITSYAVLSQNGLLAQSNWTSLTDSNIAGAGWREANPTNNHLAELNLQNSFNVAVGQPLALGNAYNGAAATPAQEDILFQYSTLDGQLHQGIVEYAGNANDFTLFVDPTSGNGTIGNLSPHIAPPTVTGYAIRSAAGQLTEATWNSLTNQGGAFTGWGEANPSTTLLAELNLLGSTQFTNGTLISLGKIFASNGTRDLTFEYTTLGGELLAGTVQYGAIPTPPAGVQGDYNGNGTVDAADYVVWRNTLGNMVTSGTGADGSGNGTIDLADYQFWRARFGRTAGSGSAAATSAAVPEPGSMMLVLIGLTIALASQRAVRP